MVLIHDPWSYDHYSIPVVTWSEFVCLETCLLVWQQGSISVFPHFYLLAPVLPCPRCPAEACLVCSRSKKTVRVIWGCGVQAREALECRAAVALCCTAALGAAAALQHGAGLQWMGLPQAAVGFCSSATQGLLTVLQNRVQGGQKSRWTVSGWKKLKASHPLSWKNRCSGLGGRKGEIAWIGMGGMMTNGIWLKMAMEIAEITVTKQYSHVTLHFMTSSLSNRNSTPCCHCNLRTRRSRSDLRRDIGENWDERVVVAKQFGISRHIHTSTPTAKKQRARK